MSPPNRLDLGRRRKGRPREGGREGGKEDEGMPEKGKKGGTERGKKGRKGGGRARKRNDFHSIKKERIAQGGREGTYQGNAVNGPRHLLGFKLCEGISRGGYDTPEPHACT
eukprot:evm.model.NODE_35698_length_7174_cov_17.167549.1